MKTRNYFTKTLLAVLLIIGVTFTSCEKDTDLIPTEEIATNQEQEEISKEIIEKLEKAGFDTKEGLYKDEDGYVVEHDITMTVEEINELAKSLDSTGSKKHYRLGSIIASTKPITVYIDPRLGSAGSNALNTALARYNQLDLKFSFKRSYSKSSYDILIIPYYTKANTRAKAGFPKNGKPHNLIRVNTRYYSTTSKDRSYATVLAHEIGHAIGFMHTDSKNANRIHISRTPLGSSPNSWMLPSIGTNVDRPFSGSDIMALYRLYPKSGSNKAVPFYQYYNSKYVNHAYSAQFSELGRGRGGYKYQKVAFKVFRKGGSGLKALYRYYSGNGVNNAYTTRWGELGYGNSSYRFEGIAGYVYSSPGTGRKPLYRYYQPAGVNNYYTTNFGEFGSGRNGFRYEGIIGYVPR